MFSNHFNTLLKSLKSNFLSSHLMALPNFMIVGAPKAGTTSLAYYLSQHPDIFMTPKKEPRFFIRSEYDKGLKFYESQYFNDWKNEKAIGEATVGYLMRPYAAKRIFEAVGRIKIIILLRNPVERAFSAYQMSKKNPRMKESFIQVLEKNLNQLNLYRKSFEDNEPEMDSSKYHQINWHSQILQNGHYLEHIKRYEKYFGKESLLILFASELKKNPLDVIKKICKFLEVDSSCSDYNLELKNQLKIQYRIDIFRPLKRILGVRGFNRLSALFPNVIKKPILFLISYLKNKPVITENEKRWLLKYYLNGIEELESFLGVDLKEWKE